MEIETHASEATGEQYWSFYGVGSGQCQRLNESIRTVLMRCPWTWGDSWCHWIFLASLSLKHPFPQHQSAVDATITVIFQSALHSIFCGFRSHSISKDFIITINIVCYICYLTGNKICNTQKLASPLMSQLVSLVTFTPACRVLQ